MSSPVEQEVARHYSHSSIEQTILAALIATGKDPDNLTADDLAPVDEFHIGGREATKEVAAAMQLRPGMHLLDVGCGIGGPARYFAACHAAHVTGIDLTPDFVEAAQALSRRTGLASQVAYHCGSALDLPFDAAAFDGAYLFHVGMNIENKARLFAEVRRVLKPGGVFAVYDVMRTGEGELGFPVPWAAAAETSFLETPERYAALLEEAGFQIVSQRSRREFAIEFFAAMRERAAAGTASPLGLPILMGASAGIKMGNMMANLGAGLIAPVEMISRCGA